MFIAHCSIHSDLMALTDVKWKLLEGEAGAGSK